MVTKWGLSEAMGPLMYDEGGEEVFLGRSPLGTAVLRRCQTRRRGRLIKEVRQIIDECYREGSGRYWRTIAASWT